MINFRDLLILNLTLQVFDGLFSYQVFSLGAPEANPFVSAAISSWGVTYGLLYKKVLSVRSAADLYAETAPRVVSNKSNDCDRFGLHVRCCRFSMAAPELIGA